MIDRQHRESRDCSERKRGTRWRETRPESSNRPYQQERSAYQIAGRVVDAWIVPEDANDRLQVYDHVGVAEIDGRGSGVVEVTVRRSHQQIGMEFLHPIRRNV